MKVIKLLYPFST